MSRKRRDPEAPGRTRLSLTCSAAQKDLIEQAAARASTDVSTWVLGQVMPAAGAVNGHSDLAPVVLGGDAAGKLRAIGDRQGITPERALAQILSREA